jgi:hypothetical protein
MTVSDFRDSMTDLSKILHEKGVKEFYLISGSSFLSKHSIPEKLRVEFEEFYSGGDYGEYTANTAEFIHQFARDMEANIILMDFEIDEFLENLTAVRNSVAEEIEE